MRKLIYTILFSAMAACITGCQEKAELEIELGVNNTEIRLTSNAASYCIIPVYSNRSWNVRFEEPCDWAVLSPRSGSGYGEVRMEYDDNLDGVDRQTTFMVTTGDKTCRITIIQPS